MYLLQEGSFDIMPRATSLPRALRSRMESASSHGRLQLADVEHKAGL